VWIREARISGSRSREALEARVEPHITQATSTSKTLSQTAIVSRARQSYPAWCLRSRGDLPKTVDHSLLCGLRVVVKTTEK